MTELTTKLSEALRLISFASMDRGARDTATEALRLYDEAKAQPVQDERAAFDAWAEGFGLPPTSLNTVEPWAAWKARAALAATPAPVEPVAWGMRDKTTGLILDVICPDEHESFEGDYTVPLFAAPVAQAEPRKPLTESALCREVCEYGPQSEDEETGFRDGFRAAERVHGIGASTNESNK